MRRIGISSGSLVSNTAVSLAAIELSQLGADAGLGPPARLATETPQVSAARTRARPLSDPRPARPPIPHLRILCYTPTWVSICRLTLGQTYRRRTIRALEGLRPS
jgi:hypothetical protein